MESEQGHDKGIATFPNENDSSKKSESEKLEEPKLPSRKYYMPPLPFPQRFAKAKLDS